MTDPLKFKLVISYDGRNYAGWQRQKTGIGVQEKIEGVVAKLFPGASTLHSSSRTDQGVHALAMVAHLEIPQAEFKMTVEKLRLALNAHLPEDIRITEARRMPAEFHARFDAKGKQYRYFVWNHHALQPLFRHATWHVPKTLEVASMRKAAGLFVGEHDFRSFAATHPYQIKDTVRTVTRCDLKKQGPLLTFRIEGTGFLYKMCRGIVGTLIQVGHGKFSPDVVTEMLSKKDRRVAGMSAPAHGLVLWKVSY